MQLIPLDGLIDEHIGWLQVTMYDRHGRLTVQIVHAPGNLYCPIDENIGRDFTTGQDAIQATTTRIFHDQAELCLQADST